MALSKPSILQWNCRGIQGSREEIESFITEYSPVAICIQETLIKPNQDPTFKHYTPYYYSIPTGRNGVGLLIKKIA